MNTKEDTEEEGGTESGKGKGREMVTTLLLFFLKVKRNRVGNEEKAQGLRGLTVKS